MSYDPSAAVINPTSSSGMFGMSQNDLYLIQLIEAAKAQHDASHPKFTQEPMTPQQQKIWDIYYKSLTDPAFAGNAHLVNAIATGVAQQGPPSWTSPKTSTGEVGYGGRPPVDWKSILASYGTPGAGGGGAAAGGTSGSIPALPGGGSGPAGSFGSPGSFGGELTGWPTGGGSSIGAGGFSPSSIQEIVQRYGKPVAEAVMGFMTANPALGVKAAWDAYQAWAHGPSYTGTPIGPVKPISITDPMWAAGSGGNDRLPNPKNPNVPDLTPAGDYNQQYKDAIARGGGDPNSSVNYTKDPGYGFYLNQGIVGGHNAEPGGPQENYDWSNVQNNSLRRLPNPSGGHLGGIRAV